jgi:hypothetical protein
MGPTVASANGENVDLNYISGQRTVDIPPMVPEAGVDRAERLWLVVVAEKVELART